MTPEERTARLKALRDWDEGFRPHYEDEDSRQCGCGSCDAHFLLSELDRVTAERDAQVKRLQEALKKVENSGDPTQGVSCAKCHETEHDDPRHKAWCPVGTALTATEPKPMTACGLGVTGLITVSPNPFLVTCPDCKRVGARESAIAATEPSKPPTNKADPALPEVRRLYSDYGGCLCAEPPRAGLHDSACALAKAALTATEPKP